MGVNPLDGFVQSCVAGSPRKAKKSPWSVTSCCSMLDNLERFSIKWNHLIEKVSIKLTKLEEVLIEKVFF